MPCKVTKPMDERVRFIGDLTSCRYTMTELCEIYGISRKTAYEWSKRNGLAQPRRRRRRRDRPAKQAVQTQAPNEVWTADFKGQFRLGNRQS